MASKRRIRRKSCTGKQRYASELDARRGLFGLRRAGIGGLVPYRCAFCSAFHVGHPPRRVRQAMAATA